MSNACENISGQPKNVTEYEKILGIDLPDCAQTVEVNKEGGVEFILTDYKKNTWEGKRIDSSGKVYRLSNELKSPTLIGSVSVDKLQKAKEMILGMGKK